MSQEPGGFPASLTRWPPIRAVTGKARGKQRWNDAPPAREFLGVTQAQTDEIINKVAQDCLNRIAQKGKL